jgi:hypothetical protein
MPTLKIEGLNSTLEAVSEKKLFDAAQKALSAYALKVDMDAKRRVPVDMGRLRSSIIPETGNLQNLEISFTAGVDYAAYIEFGTGPAAAKYVPSLEPEWQAIASAYYVNGKGRMPARPFLHPAVMENLPLFNQKFDEYYGRP